MVRIVQFYLANSRWLVFLAAGALVLASPKTASAHLVNSGVGPFFDGVAHFFVSAYDLLAVVAWVLLIGLSGKIAVRRFVQVLPGAWLTGTLVGYFVPWRFVEADWIGAISLLVGGLLLAIHPHSSPRTLDPIELPSFPLRGRGQGEPIALPSPPLRGRGQGEGVDQCWQVLFVGLGIVVGLVHGVLNGAAISATNSTMWTSLGIVAAAGVLGLLLGAATVSMKSAWQRIALRVVGSWIAAIGLLSLAWQFRPTG